MNTEQLNLTELNSTVLDIYVKPFDDWHTWVEGFEVYPKLNLTWVVDSFEDNRLRINVTFLDPIQISPQQKG